MSDFCSTGSIVVDTSKCYFDAVSYTHLESMENDKRVWEKRAEIFFNEGGIVGSPQRQELWAVIARCV